MATNYVVSSSRPGLGSVVVQDDSSLAFVVANVGVEKASSVDVSTTGVSGTGSAGTVSTSIQTGALTGVSGTSGVGSPTISFSTIRDVVGNAITSAVGSLSDTLPEDTTGVSASFATGAMTATSFTPADVPGVAADFAIGDIGDVLSVPLHGVGGTGRVGSVIAGHVIPGVSASFGEGSFSVVITTLKHLTGVSATFSASPLDHIGITLPGVDMYGDPGVISDEGDVDVPHTNREVNGNTLTSHIGSLVRARSYSRTVPSVSMHATVGRFPATIRETLTGHTIHGSVGAFRVVLSAGGLTLDDFAVTQYNVVELDTNVSLRYSDDKGMTWGFPISQSLGEGGDYIRSLQWTRLGSNTRDRVFEISFTSPCETSITGIFYEVVQGQS